jgi:hypothetical protein
MVLTDPPILNLPSSRKMAEGGTVLKPSEVGTAVICHGISSALGVTGA